MSYHPLGDCVLITPEPDPTYAEMIGTELHIPDAYKWGPVDAPKWGRIMAFGSECHLNKVCWATSKEGFSAERKATLLHEGDRVLYGKFGWAKVPIGEGKHLALVRECDLIAVDR